MDDKIKNFTREFESIKRNPMERRKLKIKLKLRTQYMGLTATWILLKKRLINWKISKPQHGEQKRWNIQRNT